MRTGAYYQTRAQQGILACLRIEALLLSVIVHPANIQDRDPVARLDGQPRIDLRGCISEARLPPAPALFFAMALHELATNATKYGTLSVPGGRVTVFCRADPGGGRPVVEWVERDGSPICRGFGMRLLQRGLAQGGLAAEMAFEPEGLRARIHFPGAEGQAGPAAQETH
ncbi:MAG: sensor histidine kinase [Acetobacteraceae bacterium]|nr:sensor histidine kinase [Acetobacteraceae bacterium]MDI3307490.1 sensor histidine kinase [Acetobacteraceae bacterium]